MTRTAAFLTPSSGAGTSLACSQGHHAACAYAGCDCTCHYRRGDLDWANLAVVFLVVLSVALVANAQRIPGRRVPVPIVYVAVDSPTWHWNGPGQDGSSKYALDGGAYLTVRTPDGRSLSSSLRDADGGFAFSSVAPGTLLTWEHDPTIIVTSVVNVSNRKPPDPQPSNPRRRQPSNPPMVVPVGAEWSQMPPPVLLNFMATVYPGVYIVITDSKVWFIRERQGLPIPSGFRQVWP